MRDKDRSITRQQLAARIAQESNLSVKDANVLMEQIVEEIYASLTTDADVMISGFGKFTVQQKSSRMGRNPKTGEPVQIEARKVLKFSACEGLREAVNSSLLPGAE